MAKLVVCPHEEPDGEVCGYRVRSTDEDEVVSAVQHHAEEEHALELSRDDVQEMIQEE